MVESKANDYTVKSIQAQVGNLTASIDNLLNRIPDRDIMDLVNTVLQSNEDIKRRFEVSKKVYKKAVGDLYKRRLITIEEGGVRLVQG